MRLRVVRRATIGLLLAAVGVMPASAVDPGGATAGAHPTSGQPSAISGNGARTQAHPTTVRPSSLNAAQCYGLGGKVVLSTTCASLTACARADQDHVIHTACIEIEKE